MSISEVTVKGTYKKADGKPETGTVKFRPALWQQSGSGIDAVLDSSGSFQTKFPSSDSSNWPDGLQIPYRVTVAVSSGTYVKELTLKSADSPVDLPTLFPIVSPDSGGSGGGSGGVPAAHAATHSPGGADPLPELAKLGNLLSPGQALCRSTEGMQWAGTTAPTVDVTPGAHVGAAITGVASGTTSIGLSGFTKGGSWPVTPGQTLTWQCLARAESASQIFVRILWWRADGVTPATPSLSDSARVPPAAGSAWTPLSVTATVPPDARFASLMLIFVSATGAWGQAQRGLWVGAGGDWRPPGEIIPGLGFRTTKLGNAELLSVWQNGKWAPLSGDTGTFTVGNGTIWRVGNSVYLTATGYTPPAGFRPAQGGTAPTNVWYVTVDDWPTSVPGSAKL